VVQTFLSALLLFSLGASHPHQTQENRGCSLRSPPPESGLHAQRNCQVFSQSQKRRSLLARARKWALPPCAPRGICLHGLSRLNAGVPWQILKNKN
ncbi:hypothetical protein, partial [Xanthomonas phaseoli]|uniref:hypothetical protein n=1 Tax=Xanthomonas phaseoli TaxID=1985254 RepID=UPI001ED945B4